MINSRLHSLLVSRSISIPLKYLCLFTLVIQTSTLVLALRYSRKTSADDGQKYLPSTAVVVSEVLKLFTCCMVLFKKSDSSVNLLKKDLRNQVFENWTDSVKLMVPAVLYTIQNNLLFLALSYLDAATYQVSCIHFRYILLSKEPLRSTHSHHLFSVLKSYYHFLN